MEREKGSTGGRARKREEKTGNTTVKSLYAASPEARPQFLPAWLFCGVGEPRESLLISPMRLISLTH